MFLADATNTMQYNVGFESQTVLYIGLMWVIVKIIPVIIFCILFAMLWRWVSGNKLNLFDWVKEWRTQKKAGELEAFETDALKWEKEVNGRVNILNQIKRTETAIRHELDTLHEVKIEKGKNGEEK